jgi:serine/threonine protein kinase/tetratricopeptide (TPR) repeat protein
MAIRNWSQIETLFLEAIDLPVEQRSEFLNQACAGDRELRAEIDSLLAKDVGSDDPIAQALAQEAALLLKPPILAGERLGAYRILREIGRGGMGAVYLAERDDDQYRQQVAIKLVKRGMDTAEVLRRFRHERQILAGLEHPYIARLLDGGSTQDGRPFLVMELVEGKPIDSYCKEYALSIEDRCRLFLKVSEAVAYAHRKLIVHRDLKPRNILVAGPESSNPGCPKLLDFGLAKLLASNGERGVTATALRGRPLTPDYASPEQIRGAALNTAADIYSLGVILYELLVGARPHDLQSLAPREWERTVCECEVARPSSLAPSHRLRRKLQGDLDNILMKALRKDADRRYRSVDEFASDIRAYLECRPVLARPDSLWYRTAKFTRRRRLPLLAGAAALAGLVAGTVIAIVQAHDAQVARRVAETRQQEAQRARRVAEAEHSSAERERDSAITEQRRAEDRLAQMLSLSERSLSDVYTLMERLPGAGPARREMIFTTLGFLEKLSKDAGSNARLRVALAKAYLRLGDLQVDPGSDSDGGLKSYAAGTALLEGPLWDSAVDRERLLVWLTLQRQSSAIILRTDPLGAVARLRTATATLERLPAAVQSETEFVHARAGLYHFLAAASHSDLHRTREYAGRYLAAISTLLQQDPADTDLSYEVSAAHVELGWALWALGDPDATADHYLKAVGLREQLVKLRPSDVVYHRSLMLAYEHLAAVEGGGLVNSLGKPELALAWYRKALPLAEAAAADPSNTVAAVDYAALLLRMASVDVPPEGLSASLATLRRSAAMFESLKRASGGRNAYDVYLVDVYTLIGRRLLAMASYADAIAQYQRALAVAGAITGAENNSPGTSQRIFEAESGIARAMALAGNRSGALDQVARLLARTPPPDADQSILQSPSAQALLALAAVHRVFEEWTPAREAAERAIAAIPPVRADAWNPNAPILREAQSLIAECAGRE